MASCRNVSKGGFAMGVRRRHETRRKTSPERNSRQAPTEHGSPDLCSVVDANLDKALLGVPTFLKTEEFRAKPKNGRRIVGNAKCNEFQAESRPMHLYERIQTNRPDHLTRALNSPATVFERQARRQCLRNALPHEGRVQAPRLRDRVWVICHPKRVS